MSVNLNYDVIIVGAGPAGATLAGELAIAGIQTLVVEKHRLPRYKCCGGGITFKVSKLLDTETQNLLINSISGLSLSYDGNSLTKYYEQPIIYTVNRDRFDFALAKKAKRAGAEIVTGNAALNIEMKDGYTEVITENGIFQGRFVVGADGAHSLVARTLGIDNHNKYIFGIETEVSVSVPELAKWQSQVVLGLGSLKPGYAWLFPKSDHLSVGIGCTGQSARHLKKYYYKFLNSLNLGDYSIKQWRGGVIPYCDGHATVTKGRALLLGDAAGLADPLTGEGIYNAILSARLAASVIKEALANNSPNLSDYAKAVADTILPEMKIAYLFSKILPLIPHRLFKLLQTEDRVWRAGCQLLRGERNYSDITNRLNSLGGIYNFIYRK